VICDGGGRGGGVGVIFVRLQVMPMKCTRSTGHQVRHRRFESARVDIRCLTRWSICGIGSKGTVCYVKRACASTRRAHRTEF
jgi:hypothetical protein